MTFGTRQQLVANKGTSAVATDRTSFDGIWNSPSRIRVSSIEMDGEDEFALLVFLDRDPAHPRLLEQFRGVSALNIANFLLGRHCLSLSPAFIPMSP